MIHQRRHSGFTLMEMMAAMAVFTVVLTIAMGLLTLFLRLDESARRHAEGISATARLARVFRADVRAANSATVAQADGAQRIALASEGDREVRYEVNPRTIRRVVSKAGSQVNVEQFRIARPNSKFVTDAAGSIQVVTLDLLPPDNLKSSLSRRPLRISAALGADHRYEEASQ